MAFIELKNIHVNGVNMLDPNRKLWNVLRGKKPDKVRILEGVDISAKDGDRIGLIGKNGSGKSSVLKVISRIYPPHEGTVQVQGDIMSVLEAGVSISSQIQAKDALKMCFVYDKILHKYSEDLADKIFDFAELKGHEHIPPIQYSSGMKARLVLSAVLFQQGDIVMFDELLGTTDQEFTKKAIKKMEEIWSSTSIGLFVNHNAKEVEKFCDNSYVLQDGKVVDFGKTSKMIEVYNKISFS